MERRQRETKIERQRERERERERETEREGEIWGERNECDVMNNFRILNYLI
jgi:hypothetical protein